MFKRYSLIKTLTKNFNILSNADANADANANADADAGVTAIALPVLSYRRAKNKDADQLCSNCTADQCLCFHHTDSAIPLLLISKVSSFKLHAVTVQPGLCPTWSETQIVGFLMHRLIWGEKPQ